MPWYQISDTRLTDALMGRVDVSTGDLMLAGTDFDIAGVGQKLQFAQTYNSLFAPFGAVSHQRTSCASSPLRPPRGVFGL